MALILLTAAFTVIRPGAIVEGAYAKGSNKVLCYKDIKLTLLRKNQANGMFSLWKLPSSIRKEVWDRRDRKF